MYIYYLYSAERIVERCQHSVAKVTFKFEANRCHQYPSSHHIIIALLFIIIIINNIIILGFTFGQNSSSSSFVSTHSSHGKSSLRPIRENPTPCLLLVSFPD